MAIPQTLPLFPPPTEPKKPWLAIFGVGVILLILAILAAAWTIVRTTAAPTTVAARFFADLRSGQTDAAWALTSPEFRQTTSRKNLEDLSVSIRETMADAEYRTTKRELVKGTAIGTKTSIAGAARVGDKEYLTVTDLVKHEGRWTVFSFKISQ